MNEQDRPHILIVEDNSDTQLLLEHLLRKDFVLTIRQSVAEAIESAYCAEYDLLLLDINLGEDLTGLDVLERIREMDSHRTTPAIAMTAYAMPGDRERFLNLGFAAYLSKPFTRTLLLGCVDRVLAPYRGLKNC
jgi:CheY-like chemotaxis protein